MQNLIINITQENFNLISNAQINCYILNSNLNSAFIAEFVNKAHSEKKLVLISGENNLETYINNSADGLIIDTSKDENPKKRIKELQAKAKKAFIGVISRNRRHEAMLISECEPDFLIFKFWENGFAENLELLHWYNELFLIQSAAQIEEDFDYSSIDSDFIIMDDQKYNIFVAKLK